MRKFFLYLMACLYIAAGVNHFLQPEAYLRIMPPYLPAHRLLVALSGICEVLLGLLLLPQRTRIMAAWLLIALLIAVFPANIQMAVNDYREKNSRLWMALLRLPMQLLLLWWARIYTRR